MTRRPDLERRQRVVVDGRLIAEIRTERQPSAPPRAPITMPDDPQPARIGGEEA